MSLVLAMIAGQALVGPSLDAQSLVWGEIVGEVRGPDGAPVGSVSILLGSAEGGLERNFVSDRRGRFSLPLLGPGIYSLRVESLGYRPFVLTGLELSAGDRLPVEVELTPASGLVSDVDSTAAGVAYASLRTASGVRIKPDLLRDLAFPTGSLTELAALSTSMDRFLGSEGLPASMTTIVVDGVPFAPAAHPALRGEATASPLLNGPTLASLQVLDAPGDVEWWGGGSVIGATTRSAAQRPGDFDVEASWSGEPLRLAEEEGETASAGASIWANAIQRVALVPDTAFLSLVADATVLSTPRPAPIGPAGASGLGGVGEGLRQRLLAPGLDETTRAAAQARLDWWFDPDRRLVVRGGVGYHRQTSQTDGSPTLGYGIDPLQTSLDLSFAGDYTIRMSDALTWEFRAGIASSQRDFDQGEVAQTLVAGPGAVFGSAAGIGGEASRTGVSLSSTLRYRLQRGALFKAGLQVRADRHGMTHSPYGGTRYLFPDLGSVPSGTAVALGGTAPDESFRTSEVGLFAQYTWTSGPAFRFSLGGRFDYDSASPEAAVNESFALATGLLNSDAPSSWTNFGGTASMTWDLTGGAGGTVFTAVGAIQNGDFDPSLTYELSANDGGARVRRVTGDQVGWAQRNVSGVGSDLPPITVFGPDMRPPRHTRVRAGLRQRLGASTALFVGTALRRSDFLPRRRNLNLAIVPTGFDGDGRPLFGDLTKLGALVVADGLADRRFSAFDAIWSLDPDGESEYRAVTVGLEHASGPLDLTASYTRSTTEDNWFGAAAGAVDAELVPGLPESVGVWEDGVSDFDVPDRFVGTALLAVGERVSIGATYRYASGLPFTPGYRRGVDVNGDGSGFNDPAFVPALGELSGLTSDWSCLEDLASAFATRNACRGEGRHALDLRLQIGIPLGGDRVARIVIDALDLLESEEGLRDTALLLVDPAAPLSGSSAPVTVNPAFGEVVVPATPGRVLRIGVRLGGL